MTERLVRCVFGLFLFAAGITMLIRAELGAAPWDVFHTGVSELTGIGVGTIIVAVGVALLLLWIPLRVRPGLGTILNAVLIGVFVDLLMPIVPKFETLLPRVVMMLGGVVVIAIGSGFYIGVRRGDGRQPGPGIGLVGGEEREVVGEHVSGDAWGCTRRVVGHGHVHHQRRVGQGTLSQQVGA